MDLGKAEIEYENRQPRVQQLDQTHALAKSYELLIRDAILANLKYTCLANSGKDIALCPVSQIAEEMWTEHEKCREAIRALVDGSSDAEVGAKFRALVESILNKISKDCAETKITLEELGELK